jgi:hypothetical protein
MPTFRASNPVRRRSGGIGPVVNLTFPAAIEDAARIVATWSRDKENRENLSLDDEAMFDVAHVGTRARTDAGVGAAGAARNRAYECYCGRLGSSNKCSNNSWACHRRRQNLSFNGLQQTLDSIDAVETTRHALVYTIVNYTTGAS